MEKAAHVSRWYFQLKSGYVVIDTYLYRIEKAETDRCWQCTSRARMDRHYTMFDFTKWREGRRKMGKRCEKGDGK